jgi:hypothetical protein
MRVIPKKEPLGVQQTVVMDRNFKRKKTLKMTALKEFVMTIYQMLLCIFHCSTFGQTNAVYASALLFHIKYEGRGSADVLSFYWMWRSDIWTL